MGTHKHYSSLAAADIQSSPACRAYSSSATISIPHGTVTVLALDSETYDTAGMHSTTTNNSRIVVPSDGHYLCIAAVLHQGQNPIGGGSLQARLHKNGAGWNQQLSPAVITQIMLQYVDVLALSAGDYLELAAYQDSGSSRNVVGGSTGSFLLVRKLV